MAMLLLCLRKFQRLLRKCSSLRVQHMQHKTVTPNVKSFSYSNFSSYFLKKIYCFLYVVEYFELNFGMMKFWLYNTSNSKSKTIQTYFCIEAMKKRCFFFVLWKFRVAVHFMDEVGFKKNCCSDYIWRAGRNTHQPAHDWQKLKIFSSLNLPNRFHVATFILGVFNTSCSRCLLGWSSELRYAAVTFLESSARTWHTFIKVIFPSPGEQQWHTCYFYPCENQWLYNAW